MTSQGDLDWLLANMVATVDPVRHAVLLSGDGRPYADLSKDDQTERVSPAGLPSRPL
jgi:predicted regulator of Ras-like GTPase activity (Roadblock/LC7/MglB family)